MMQSVLSFTERAWEIRSELLFTTGLGPWWGWWVHFSAVFALPHLWLLHHLCGMWTLVFLWQTTDLTGFIPFPLLLILVLLFILIPQFRSQCSPANRCADKGSRDDGEAGDCQLGLLRQAIPYRRRAGQLHDVWLLGGVMDVVPATR